MKKIRSFLVKYTEELNYLFFGVLTTLVNFVIYFPLHEILNISAAVSNVIAWAVAVVFAYFTNKRYVFQSKDWNKQTIITEMWKFVACRIGSGLVETLFLLVTVDVLHFNGTWMKILICIVVVILNYISSKLLVFKK